MRRNLLIVTGAIFVTAVLIYGTSHRSGGSSSRVAASSTAGAAPNKLAPDFELKSMDGRSVRLSDFRGKAVVLNFWATYCAPCRIEMPWLVDFYERYKSQGLEIVGVSMDDGNQEQVGAFTKEMHVNYTILLGNHSVGDAYGGARFLPQTFLVDRDGRIIQTLIGIKTKEDFEDNIRLLLATRPQTR
jgi:peroxiredoxin